MYDRLKTLVFLALRPGEPPLRVLTQEGMCLHDIELLLRETQVNGFPVVVSSESQYVVGFVSRRDLSLAISISYDNICIYHMLMYVDNALVTRPEITLNSPAVFAPSLTEPSE